MNEISVIEKQLPDTIEELSQFVFYGREKLIALKAAIKASTKAEVVTDALQKMKEEEQGLAEAVLLGEAKIGELLQNVPKAKNQNSAVDTAVYSKAKEDIGISQKQAQRYQTLAKHVPLFELAQNWGYDAIAPMANNKGLKSFANKMFIHHEQASLEQLITMIANASEKEEAFQKAIDMLMGDGELRMVQDSDKLMIVNKAEMKDYLKKMVDEELRMRKGGITNE